MYPPPGLQIQIRVITGVRVYALGLVWPLAFHLICLSQVHNAIAFFFYFGSLEFTGVGTNCRCRAYPRAQVLGG